MKPKEKIELVIFFIFLFSIAIIIRIQFPVFESVLLASQLFFQLMIAVTFIAITRNIIGINTFGVFGPAIISFALLTSGILWGIALFLDVFLLVLMVRFLFDPVKMGANHRIAILVIFTALFVTLIEIIGEISHITALESSLLFPALITSWYADRYVNKVKELGWREPNKQLFLTVIIIILSALLVGIDSMITFFIKNPELWIVLILLNVFLATKVRFRLSEHFRFKRLLSEKKIPKDDIMSMNVRNREYIEEYNPRNFFPGVEKAEIKKTLQGLGIATPYVFMIASKKNQLGKCKILFSKLNSFVIKPNKGLGGEGIIVISKKSGDKFYTIGGKEISLDELIAHVNQIIEGQFSDHEGDVAIIEERVVPDEIFEGMYYVGVPDIRVIVFNGFPVMAMSRLPTKNSDGKANLHKGAIGVGLTIASGKAVNPYSKILKRSLKYHPDTKKRIDNFTIPNWNSILELAVKGQYVSKLGYVGVDIIIDKVKGPMILEINKRPGMDIQNTNLAGLLKRLAVVEQHLPDYDFLDAPSKVQQAIKWDKGGWNDEKL